MGKNALNIKRVAMGNVTLPTIPATNSTFSASANVNIPKGAIVTGMKFFALGALTNVSNFKDATIQPSVGGQVLGSNANKASVQLSAATPVTPVLVNTDGVYVSVGGPLIIAFASSDSARTGMAGTFDIYVDYLYCSDRDLT